MANTIIKPRIRMVGNKSLPSDGDLIEMGKAVHDQVIDQIRISIASLVGGIIDKELDRRFDVLNKKCSSDIHKLGNDLNKRIDKLEKDISIKLDKVEKDSIVKLDKVNNSVVNQLSRAEQKFKSMREFDKKGLEDWKVSETKELDSFRFQVKGEVLSLIKELPAPVIYLPETVFEVPQSSNIIEFPVAQLAAIIERALLGQKPALVTVEAPIVNLPQGEIHFPVEQLAKVIERALTEQKTPIVNLPSVLPPVVNIGKSDNIVNMDMDKLAEVLKQVVVEALAKPTPVAPIINNILPELKSKKSVVLRDQYGRLAGTEDTMEYEKKLNVDGVE